MENQIDYLQYYFQQFPDFDRHGAQNQFNFISLVHVVETSSSDLNTIKNNCALDLCQEIN